MFQVSRFRFEGQRGACPSEAPIRSGRRGEITTLLTIASIIAVAVGLLVGGQLIKGPLKLPGLATETTTLLCDSPGGCTAQINDFTVSYRGTSSRAQNQYVFAGKLCFNGNIPSSGGGYELEISADNTLLGTARGLITLPSQARCTAGQAGKLRFSSIVSKYPVSCPDVSITVWMTRRGEGRRQRDEETKSVFAHTGGQICTTPTPEGSGGGTGTTRRTPTATSTPTPPYAPAQITLTPQPTIRAGCNVVCNLDASGTDTTTSFQTSGADCADGLVCTDVCDPTLEQCLPSRTGRCRAPSCTADSDCSCSPVRAATIPVRTTPRPTEKPDCPSQCVTRGSCTRELTDFKCSSPNTVCCQTTGGPQISLKPRPTSPALPPPATPTPTRRPASGRLPTVQVPTATPLPSPTPTKKPPCPPDYEACVSNGQICRDRGGQVDVNYSCQPENYVCCLGQSTSAKITIDGTIDKSTRSSEHSLVTSVGITLYEQTPSGSFAQRDTRYFTGTQLAPDSLFYSFPLFDASKKWAVAGSFNFQRPNQVDGRADLDFVNCLQNTRGRVAGVERSLCTIEGRSTTLDFKFPTSGRVDRQTRVTAQTTGGAVRTVFSVQNSSPDRAVRAIVIETCDRQGNCTTQTADANIAPGSHGAVDQLVSQSGLGDGYSLRCTLVYDDDSQSPCGVSKTIDTAQSVKFDLAVGPTGTVTGSAQSSLDVMDTDGDGAITSIDYARMIQFYGQCSEDVLHDNTFDGCVNALDASSVVEHFGESVSRL